ncbi:MAG: hypothetical protein JO354_08880 [Verrucomicrobia bacterium]|nr:hypothetical protein [Verrucomicrobiota bacterium]
MSICVSLFRTPTVLRIARSWLGIALPIRLHLTAARRTSILLTTAPERDMLLCR